MSCTESGVVIFQKNFTVCSVDLVLKSLDQVTKVRNPQRLGVIAACWAGPLLRIRIRYTILEVTESPLNSPKNHVGSEYGTPRVGDSIFWIKSYSQKYRVIKDYLLNFLQVGNPYKSQDPCFAFPFLNTPSMTSFNRSSSCSGTDILSLSTKGMNLENIVTPRKTRLSRALAKAFHIRADQVNKKRKSLENDGIINSGNNDLLEGLEGGDGKLGERIAEEAFVAKLFACISAVKAAYADLQSAQSPYDPQGVQAADQMVVSEFQLLSQLKQSYYYYNNYKIQADRSLSFSSHENTLFLAEIKELKCILKTYKTTAKKLDAQDKLKGSEIMFLRAKLEEANKESNNLLEKSFEFPSPTKPTPSHFIKCLGETVSSIRSFVRVLTLEMKYAGWDLDVAAFSIQPDVVSFVKASHICYAFESFVTREMFDGFNHPNFDYSSNEASCLASSTSQRRYCCNKYLELIHPDIEESLFGNGVQRKMVMSGEYPNTAFFTCFVEMAKRVWILHDLAFSLEHDVSIFQVSKGTRFSDVYMENVNDNPFLSWDGLPERESRVAFTVLPGFRIGKTFIQCQVYLV